MFDGFHKMKQTQVKIIKLAHKTFTDTLTGNLVSKDPSFSKYCENISIFIHVKIEELYYYLLVTVTVIT